MKIFSINPMPKDILTSFRDFQLIWKHFFRDIFPELIKKKNQKKVFARMVCVFDHLPSLCLLLCTTLYFLYFFSTLTLTPTQTPA